MTRTCQIRATTSKDAKLLRAIRLEALADTPEAYGTTYEESAAWSWWKWRMVARRWNYFIAECDGSVSGMASGGHNDEYPGTFWLYGMYVTPSARGSGLADDLVERVVQWARANGANELYLHVTESVTRARAFYERVGFRENGVTITMERDPSITLLTMVRRLD